MMIHLWQEDQTGHMVKKLENPVPSELLITSARALLSSRLYQTLNFYPMLVKPEFSGKTGFS